MPKIDANFPWGDSKALDASPERVVALPARPPAVGKWHFLAVLIFSQLLSEPVSTQAANRLALGRLQAAEKVVWNRLPHGRGSVNACKQVFATMSRA